MNNKEKYVRVTMTKSIDVPFHQIDKSVYKSQEQIEHDAKQIAVNWFKSYVGVMQKDNFTDLKTETIEIEIDDEIS